MKGWQSGLNAAAISLLSVNKGQVRGAGARGSEEKGMMSGWMGVRGVFPLHSGLQGWQGHGDTDYGALCGVPVNLLTSFVLQVLDA